MAGIFKAYDIRGTVPDQLNEPTAELIGRAIATFLGAKNLVVGRDMRDSGVPLSRALIRGINSTGCDVTDIGVVSTPMQYHAVGSLGTDGGVMVTASHNPAGYNGMKISARDVVPVGGASGLPDIEQLVRGGIEAPAGVAPGTITETDTKPAYAEKILGLLQHGDRRLKVAIDCANAMGYLEVEHVLSKLPVDIIGLYLEPDGTFPNHEANPLKAENMRDVQKAVLENGCDLGIAFDGDADRACFCDQNGRLISNDLMTAFLATEFVPGEEGAGVVYDLRSSHIVPETIESLGGRPIRERVGHAFMKKTLRDAAGPYGGELSGHFYFRDLWYTDSGVYAAALVLAKLSRGAEPMSELVDCFRVYYPSGEINFEVEDKDGTIEKIAAAFPDARQDRLDGITVAYDGWWANVRKSNTEPLLRLTFEAKDEGTFDRIKPQLFALLGTPSDH